MSGNLLKWQDEFADPEGAFSYPSTTDYAILKGKNNSIHFLLGQGAPSTNHNNAPLGSIYIDVINYTIYRHTATSTWTLSSA